MKPVFLSGPAAVVAAFGLAACARGLPTDAEALAERDIARAYIVSDVAKQAKVQATADLRLMLVSTADRELLDSYLADPLFLSRLPERYQDHLIQAFEADEIAAMTAWDGSRPDFEEQVAMHRFILSGALMDWHSWKAELSLPGADREGDPLLATFGAVYGETPSALRPQPLLVGP